MGFKENLKAELSFKGMTVKELSSLTGISKRTLDNYLRDNPASPTVENAVRIAQALDASVEFLVTGAEKHIVPTENASLIHHINSDLQKLGRYDLVSLSVFIRRMAQK